ncbi:hypothetical protein KBX53_00010 [Micromonospora sp. M51]|uniref:hypothetical protein n=1 Tax=Micromonospora sp. M51 TaxID=2824889 RepID=UPI001B3917B8|nr:hypothetical protein [Micromonospora sp. M51]MBQ1009365.1 hypothetical protein [Micromonospora sp. M51]
MACRRRLRTRHPQPLPHRSAAHRRQHLQTRRAGRTHRSIAADPAALTAHINANRSRQPRFLGPTAVIRGLVSLLGWSTPNQAARTAILTVLRDTPGITYHGPVTDRAGRTGIGVSATSNDIRFLLILNPATGELLAYERAALAPPPGSDRIGPSVDDYQLFLVHSRANSSSS